MVTFFGVMSGRRSRKFGIDHRWACVVVGAEPALRALARSYPAGDVRFALLQGGALLRSPHVDGFTDATEAFCYAREVLDYCLATEFVFDGWLGTVSVESVACCMCNPPHGRVEEATATPNAAPALMATGEVDPELRQTVIRKAFRDRNVGKLLLLFHTATHTHAWARTVLTSLSKVAFGTAIVGDSEIDLLLSNGWIDEHDIPQIALLKDFAAGEVPQAVVASLRNAVAGWLIDSQNRWE